MNTIACPRHGIVEVDKDQPCPACGVAAYDLNDRLARDIVRANREGALKNRKIVAGALAFVAVAVVASLQPVLAFNVGVGGTNLNLLALLAGGVAAAFGARPLALRLETDEQLRRLDNELTQRRV